MKKSSSALKWEVAKLSLPQAEDLLAEERPSIQYRWKFINNISGETIGNFLMFLPFGFLYPLSQQKPTWKKSIITGLLVVMVIELFQPIFGRAFDMNDIIMNLLGIVVSTSIFMVVKKAIKR